MKILDVALPYADQEVVLQRVKKIITVKRCPLKQTGGG